MERGPLAAYPTAAGLLSTADETLGFDLSRVIAAGPDDELIRTDNQQPAIVAVSVAHLMGLTQAGTLPPPDFVAGHSLGEYTALVAADALSYPDALRLTRRRGELMQQHGAGAMAALVGLDVDAVEAIAAEAGVEVANHNAPGQITVSGRREAVEAAMVLAKQRGAKRAVQLPVSAAFHSSLMAPVVDGLRLVVEQVEMRPARVPLVTNVNAMPITHPDDLRRELLEQICAPVRWIDVVERLRVEGVTTFYEVGPGKVLAGLITRIARDAKVVTAESLL
ncbi:MAG: ACP S-malonyltransferase [Chloroflexota bacterium]|nr:ACP S-malonyltransferase [Chloroflexota bacterium]